MSRVIHTAGIKAFEKSLEIFELDRQIAALIEQRRKLFTQLIKTHHPGTWTGFTVVAVKGATVKVKAHTREMKANKYVRLNRYRGAK